MRDFKRSWAKPTWIYADEAEEIYGAPIPEDADVISTVTQSDGMTVFERESVERAANRRAESVDYVRSAGGGQSNGNGNAGRPDGEGAGGGVHVDFHDAAGSALGITGRTGLCCTAGVAAPDDEE